MNCTNHLTIQQAANDLQQNIIMAFDKANKAVQPARNSDITGGAADILFKEYDHHFALKSLFTELNTDFLAMTAQQTHSNLSALLLKIEYLYQSTCFNNNLFAKWKSGYKALIHELSELLKTYKMN